MESYDEFEYRKSKFLVLLMKAVEENKALVILEFGNMRIKAVDSSWHIFGPVNYDGFSKKHRLSFALNGIEYQVDISINAWANFCWKVCDRVIPERKRKLLSQNEAMEKLKGVK
jgi:hypothetical protein